MDTKRTEVLDQLVETVRDYRASPRVARLTPPFSQTAEIFFAVLVTLPTLAGGISAPLMAFGVVPLWISQGLMTWGLTLFLAYEVFAPDPVQGGSWEKVYGKTRRDPALKETLAILKPEQENASYLIKAILGNGLMQTFVSFSPWRLHSILLSCLGLIVASWSGIYPVNTLLFAAAFAPWLMVISTLRVRYLNLTLLLLHLEPETTDLVSPEARFNSTG